MELVRNVTVGLMKATIRPVPTEAVDTLSKTTGNFGNILIVVKFDGVCDRGSPGTEAPAL
jgi:hypothetical protein